MRDVTSTSTMEVGAWPKESQHGGSFVNDAPTILLDGDSESCFVGQRSSRAEVLVKICSSSLLRGSREKMNESFPVSGTGPT